MKHTHRAVPEQIAAALLDYLGSKRADEAGHLFVALAQSPAFTPKPPAEPAEPAVPEEVSHES